MANVKELLKAEENGSLSFGDYSLTQKTKLDDFSFEGDTYKVKTFQEITRLEKNGGVVYESVPGSAVHGYKETERQIVFETEAADDLQITLEVEPKYMLTIPILASSNPVSAEKSVSASN